MNARVVETARRSGRITDRQAEELRALLERGVTDPCVDASTPPRLAKLWTELEPRRRGAGGSAVADLRTALVGRGKRYYRVAFLLAKHQGWSGLEAHLAAWTATTGQEDVLAGVAWAWMQRTDEWSSHSDDNLCSVDVAAAAADPLRLVSCLNAFKRADGGAHRFHACRVVDALAVDKGWWQKGDARRADAFVLTALEEALVEHEYVSEKELLFVAGEGGEEVDVVASVERMVAENRLVRVGSSSVTTIGVHAVVRLVSKLAQGEYQTPVPTEWEVNLSDLTGEQAALAAAVGQGERLVACCAPGGTGKSHTAARLLRSAPGGALCIGPTWKAINRLRDELGTEEGAVQYMTIQRFRYEDPPSVDLVVVDESSMLTMLQVGLLLSRYAHTPTRLLFLGDSEQLPPIGRGAAFVDLCRLVRTSFALTACMRTGCESLLALASAVRSGRHLTEGAAGSADGRVDVVPTEDPVGAVSAGYVFAAPWEDGYEQIIACKNEHVDQINRAVQEALGRKGPLFSGCYVGDAVRIVKNTDAYKNGMEGVLLDTLVEEEAVRKGGGKGRKTKTVGVVLLGGGSRVRVEDGHLVPAYACTVHKVQGSEYARVSFVLLPVRREMMSKQLLYVAVTRAKERVRLVGRVDLVKEHSDQPRRTLLSLDRE